MIPYIVLTVFVLVFIILIRDYKQYASGLRENPSILLWILTHYIRWKGWATEEYCLRTTSLNSYDRSGYLNDDEIPLRNKSRPKMLRGTPHRQLNQQAPDEIMYEMQQFLESIAIPLCGGCTLNNQLLLRGKSKVEYTGAYGLFLPNADSNSFGKGEFAHLHSNDGSFHMSLHPSDVKLLVEKQWAELFPLAGVNILNRIKIPDGYSLIYAPQNEDDLKVWKIILTAAIQNARANRIQH